MKAIVVLLVVISVAIAQDDKYSKYNNVDIDMILANKRILSRYIACLLDKAPCAPEGRDLKAILPDALQSSCSKCNEKQRAAAEKVIRHLKNNNPREWQSLLAKYDSQGNYQKRFQAQQAALKV